MVSRPSLIGDLLVAPPFALQARRSVLQWGHAANKLAVDAHNSQGARTSHRRRIRTYRCAFNNCSSCTGTAERCDDGAGSRGRGLHEHAATRRAAHRVRAARSVHHREFRALSILRIAGRGELGGGISRACYALARCATEIELESFELAGLRGKPFRDMVDDVERVLGHPGNSAGAGLNYPAADTDQALRLATALGLLSATELASLSGLRDVALACKARVVKFATNPLPRPAKH